MKEILKANYKIVEKSQGFKSKVDGNFETITMFIPLTDVDYEVFNGVNDEWPEGFKSISKMSNVLGGYTDALKVIEEHNKDYMAYMMYKVKADKIILHDVKL